MIGLDMRGLLTLPSWVCFEDAEQLNQALGVLNRFRFDEESRERELTRC